MAFGVGDVAHLLVRLEPRRIGDSRGIEVAQCRLPLPGSGGDLDHDPLRQRGEIVLRVERGNDLDGIVEPRSDSGPERRSVGMAEGKTQCVVDRSPVARVAVHLDGQCAGDNQMHVSDGNSCNVASGCEAKMMLRLATSESGRSTTSAPMLAMIRTLSRWKARQSG